MKKILVTGGAGFIGSHMVHRLVREGYEVNVIDVLLQGNKLPEEIRDKVNLFQEDIRDLDAVMRAADGVEYIVHFAAVLGVDVVADHPVETMEVEAIGMLNVIKAALHNKVKKVLYASTSGVYGHLGYDGKVSEDIPVDPLTSYAVAKRYNEIYLKSLNQEFGLDSVSVRFFNIYGPRQDNRMVLPRFIEQAQAGEPITVYGDGTQTRDFTFVDDAVEACMKLLYLPGNAEIYNVANEIELTIGELAEIVKDETDSGSEIINQESPAKRKDFEMKRRVGSSEKLFAYTGFKPNTDLRTGMKSILG